MLKYYYHRIIGAGFYFVFIFLAREKQPVLSLIELKVNDSE